MLSTPRHPDMSLEGFILEFEYHLLANSSDVCRGMDLHNAMRSFGTCGSLQDLAGIIHGLAEDTNLYIRLNSAPFWTASHKRAPCNTETDAACCEIGGLQRRTAWRTPFRIIIRRVAPLIPIDMRPENVPILKLSFGMSREQAPSFDCRHSNQ
jgi:hypothetical protein